MTSESIERLRTHSGYTVIELLVAVAIFVVLASAGLPHIDTRRTDIQTMTRQVISDYRWTRMRSITSGVHYSLAWTGSTTYEIRRLRQDGAVWNLDTVIKTVDLPSTITRGGSGTPADIIEFNTRGMVVSTENMVWQRLFDSMGGSTAMREIRVYPAGQTREFNG